MTTTQPSLFDAAPLLPSGGAQLRLHVPSMMTKQLMLQRTATGRKFRLSSNLLDALGFTANTRIDRRVIGPHQGLEFTIDAAGATKVYVRHYRRRTNNPAETQLDVNSQTDLDAAFPRWVSRVHITMLPGRIVVVPVIERAAGIRAGLAAAPSPLTAFFGCSSGVDAYSAVRTGFTCTDLAECRPIEKRDVDAAGRLTDHRESGVLTALQNVAFKRVWNELLEQLDMRRVGDALRTEPTTGMLHISVQCDDFSAAKGKVFRDMHLTDGDSSMFMAHDALHLIDTVRPATVVIENVPAFLTSYSGQMMVHRLRQWGYHVHADTFLATAFGGFTTRKRAYIVASVFPGFAFPTPTGGRTTPLWDEVVADQLGACRDITQTASVQKGLALRPGSTSPWIRLIDRNSTTAGTVMKSQNRQCKDMVAIRDDEGRIRFPNETVLRRLNGIPDDFSLDAVAGEIAAEQIGQSIDVPMHEAILAAVRDHLLAHWQEGAATLA